MKHFYLPPLFLLAFVFTDGCCRPRSGPPLASSPAPEPTVRASTSGKPHWTITKKDRFAWSCYMICFGVGRDYTGLFFDRPLDRPVVGGVNARLIDLNNAVAAGLDALSIDLFILDKYANPCFRNLVDLIEDRHLPIGLSPMFDGFGHPQLTEDDVVAKIREWFERFAAEDCVIKTAGKPVIFTYGASALKPAAWKRIFSRLRAAGCEGFWIFEGGGPLCLGPEPRFDSRAPWLDIFDSAYTFTPGRVPDRPMLNARLYRERYGRAGKFWVGSTRTGYWRPEIAVYVSPEGTARYRRSWAAVRQARIPWVQQATWNDFSENHGIMPSADKSTTFTELTRELVRDWKGLPSDVSEPRLFLSRMREVQVGESALYELLAFFPAGVESARFDLALFDGSGILVHRFPSRKLTVKGLAAPHFTVPVASLPAGRILIPRATLRIPPGTEIAMDGQPTIVRRAGFYPERCYSWIYEPAHRQLHGVDIRFSIDGTPAGGALSSTTAKGNVSMKITSPVPLVDVEILHRGKPVHIMRRQAKDVFPAITVRDNVRLPSNRLGHLDWGFYQVRVTSADRRVVVSRPVFVDPPPGSEDLIGCWPFDRGADFHVLDASPWMRDGRLGGRTHYRQHWPARVPDGRGGKCLRFDGVDDRVQMDGPVVPPIRFTVECRIKPEAWGWPGKNEPAMILASANADVVLQLRPDGMLRLTRKADRGWARVDGRAPVPLNRWTHVAVTFDGTTMTLFRDRQSVGSAEASGTRKISRFALGFNTVTRGSFYRGCIDDVRIYERVLTPQEFKP